MTRGFLLLLLVGSAAAQQDFNLMQIMNAAPSLTGKQADPEQLQAFLKSSFADAADTVQKISQDSAAQGLFAGFNNLFKQVAPQAQAVGEKAKQETAGTLQELRPDAPSGKGFLGPDFQNRARAALADEGTQAIGETMQEGLVSAAASATQDAAKEVKQTDFQPWIQAVHNAESALGRKSAAAANRKGELISTQKYAEAMKHDDTVPQEMKENKDMLKKFIQLYRKNPTVMLDTSMGSMEVEVLLEEMPMTASNFLDLCSSGFYDQTHVHRAIANFMVQAGDPITKENPKDPLAGTGGPVPASMYEILAGPKKGKKVRRSRANGCIPDEHTRKISNDRFTLAMANTGQPNSGGSQFFINVADNYHLDWFNKDTPSSHPVFGKVTAGQMVAHEISQVKVSGADMPLDPVMLVKCSVKEPPKEDAF